MASGEDRCEWVSGMNESKRKLRRVFAYLRVHGLAASVEAREHAGVGHSASAKSGADRPLVLCDKSGQRVVSVSPAARQRGVQPGVSLWEAEQQCPEILIAQPDPEKYEYFWQQVLDICGDYSPHLRQDFNDPSQDSEAHRDVLLDLTGTELLFGAPRRIAQEIRNRLKVNLGVIASVGLGSNRLVARLACESAPPGEVVEVTSEQAAEFVGALPVSALPGVDAEGVQRLNEMGIRRAKELAALPERALQRTLGEWGRSLWQIARGDDPQEQSGFGATPTRRWERGLFSVQLELRPPTEERERIRAALREVTEEVARKLRQRGQLAQQLKLNVVFRDLRRVSTRRTLSNSTRSGELLFRAALALFDRMKLNGRLVRRVRVSVARLSPGPNGGQLDLPLLEQDVRREWLAEQVHRVKDRYGESSVTRGAALTSADQRQTAERHQ